MISIGNNSTLRVMWLLNHGTARKFEIKMLKDIGIKEIYTPKHFPPDHGFRTASIDFSEDANLSILPAELKILNDTDWYGAPSKEAWKIANEHFDVLFFMFYNYHTFKSIVSNFNGSIIARAYGFVETTTYYKLIDWITNTTGAATLRQLGNRFWFAHAYAHQADVESKLLKDRALYLPLGLTDTTISKKWNGMNKKIFFVCPHIKINPYYESVYTQFQAAFKGLPYLIGGAQGLNCQDPHVLGFVSEEEFKRNMMDMRVMYYHSIEPNHIHYHPFEAIRAGMPLIFMAGGLLDNLGGKNLPGRCKTIREARQKIERILKDDWDLIEKILKTQPLLLEPMNPVNCVNKWQIGLKKVYDALLIQNSLSLRITRKKVKRIAVLVPIPYRGGSLRGAKLLAEAIYTGSQQAGEKVEVIFAYLENTMQQEEALQDLPLEIKRRAFEWTVINREQANRAMIYAGKEQVLNAENYFVPDDGMKQFTDCDLWIIVSDRLSYPLLPICPYILMVYDYLQRYEPVVPQDYNYQLISAANKAECILVTTDFTRQDAINFAGLPSTKVHKLPMLAPSFNHNAWTKYDQEPPYFLWSTNLSIHKNHENAVNALQLYYDKYEGKLLCKITGVGTKDLFRSTLPHLLPLKAIYEKGNILKRMLKVLGELPDYNYRKTLAAAQFFWHAGRIDNGTFSVIEAAQLGVPSLSSLYPAMKEIDSQFKLNLSWMNAMNVEDMAFQLKKMETEASMCSSNLPTREVLAQQSVEQLAGSYWNRLREYL